MIPLRYQLRAVSISSTVFLRPEGIQCSADLTLVPASQPIGAASRRVIGNPYTQQASPGWPDDKARLSQPGWAVYTTTFLASASHCAKPRPEDHRRCFSQDHIRLVCRRLDPPCPSIGRLTFRLPLRVLIEEANHLRGGVWALGISVGAGGATSRPRVPEPWTVHRSAMARAGRLAPEAVILAAGP